jgi:hypothetical protein
MPHRPLRARFFRGFGGRELEDRLSSPIMTTASTPPTATNIARKPNTTLGRPSARVPAVPRITMALIIAMIVRFTSYLRVVSETVAAGTKEVQCVTDHPAFRSRRVLGAASTSL